MPREPFSKYHRPYKVLVRAALRVFERPKYHDTYTT